MTDPFAATTATETTEAEFARTLTVSGLRYDDVQCPISDSPSASLAMQQHAIKFNQMVGTQIIELRWRPPS